MPITKENLGKLIKNARKLKSKQIGHKFTQNNLADAVGKSRSYIGDIEAGRTYPSFILLNKIAEVCEVPLNFFQDAEGHGVMEEAKGHYEIKKDPVENYNKYQINSSLKTPEEAMKFILQQPAIMGFGGFDINKMTDEEIMEFANELLRQLQLISYKYKK